ncbi:hypothetical protein [Bradyrhizobium sp. SZCCHNR2028]|uniref:hypothetical protein n=1 Tax=Bradyrhizobium sp. SZCCHNR2028 TaxID=3057382 RepID=UPI0028EFF2B2|nr:hypothetical protein [Bradyrhizobium sp. SZCCHNR2028]
MLLLPAWALGFNEVTDIFTTALAARRLPGDDGWHAGERPITEIRRSKRRLGISLTATRDSPISLDGFHGTIDRRRRVAALARRTRDLHHQQLPAANDREFK